MRRIKLYGFSIGDVVETLVNLYDEKEDPIVIGTRLRLIAFAPKVVIHGPLNRRAGFQDGKEYFFNAVRDSDKDYWDRSRKNGQPYGARIRADFCTVKKVR